MVLEKVVDLDRYPLDELNSAAGQRLSKEINQIFYQEGLAVLEGFIRPQALAEAVKEVTSLMPLAHHQHVVGNAYLSSIDVSLPEDHAQRLTDSTQLGAIANDQVSEDSLIKQVYLLPEVTQFIQGIIDRGPIYKYACALSSFNYTVMQAGDKLRWHFDQSDFVVSIPIQAAGVGGDFEYVKNIRSATDENFAAVKKLLLGDMTGVQKAVTPAGSLVLFQGRYTIHRVTQVQGNIPRLGALLSYANQPDIVGTDYLKLIRYGRVG